MLKNLAILRGGAGLPLVSMIVVGLALGACSGGNQNVALNQPPPQAGQPGIISGPAPMPSMASMGQPRVSIDELDSGVPTMPNENPGSGQMLGRSIPF